MVVDVEHEDVVDVEDDIVRLCQDDEWALLSRRKRDRRVDQVSFSKAAFDQ